MVAGTERDSPGTDFIDWLRDGIRTRRLIINDAKALVHTVAGTAFLVSPGVFQRYAKEHPRDGASQRPGDSASWQSVQKHFERLHLSQKTG